MFALLIAVGALFLAVAVSAVIDPWLGQAGADHGRHCAFRLSPPRALTEGLHMAKGHVSAMRVAAPGLTIRGGRSQPAPCLI